MNLEPSFFIFIGLIQSLRSTQVCKFISKIIYRFGYIWAFPIEIFSLFFFFNNLNIVCLGWIQNSHSFYEKRKGKV